MEKFKLVRQESILGLQDNKDMEKHQNVAKRVFYNHEIAAARADHASKLAQAKITQQEEALNAAREVARGFQNKVDEINREMIKRLEAIQRKEREEQERIEAE